MASIQEMAAKAKAKQSKKKKEEPFDVPKRPWDFFKGEEPDQDLVENDALESPVAIASPTPHRVADVAVKTSETKPQGLKTAAKFEPSELTKDESVADRMSIDSQSIANRMPTTDRQLVDNSLTTGRHIVDNESTDIRPLVDQSSTDRRQLVDTPSKARRQSVEKQSTTNRKLVASGVEQSVDNRSAIALLEQLGDIPLWTYLGPAQGQLLLAIYKKCDLTTLATPMLPKAFLVSAAGISAMSLGSTIDKLIKKGLIVRLLGKGGVGGFTRFQIPKSVYERMKETGADHAASVVDQMPNQLSNHMSPASRIDRIDLKNSNLSNLEPKEPEFSFDFGDWDSISFETIPDLAKSFRLEKLKADITNQKIPIAVVDLQDMIDRFQVFVMSLPRPPQNPYALFMKVVQDKVLRNKDLLAGTESMYEVWAAEAKRKRVLDLERKYIDSFTRWESMISDGQKREFVATLAGESLAGSLAPDDEKFRGYLSNYFRDKIWSSTQGS